MYCVIHNILQTGGGWLHSRWLVDYELPSEANGHHIQYTLRTRGHAATSAPASESTIHVAGWDERATFTVQDAHLLDGQAVEYKFQYYPESDRIKWWRDDAVCGARVCSKYLWLSRLAFYTHAGPYASSYTRVGSTTGDPAGVAHNTQ